MVSAASPAGSASAPGSYIDQMPDWNLVNRSHVLSAIKEYDRLGAKEFLQRYRFGRAVSYTLWHGGQEYDSKAILGVAYFFATDTPATSDEFAGGKDGAAKVLTDLGFDVVAAEGQTVTSRPRKTVAKKARKATLTSTVKVCPRCHVAMPASGICDFCD